MNIFIGNLDITLTEEVILTLFSQFGEVDTVLIVRNSNTGASRGFGFVKMADEESALKAINALDGSELEGKSLKVSMASSVPDFAGIGI